ncbi:MAG: NEW3 domain-containing protein [Candidatus Thermoplasmatota archaeon]|nr:NEW3 domain-containing protein [Candidatus Thermoplasmatota archaeon]
MKFPRPAFLFIVTVATLLVLPGMAHGAYFYLHDQPAPQHSNALLMDMSDPGKLTDSRHDLNQGPARWYTAPLEEEQKLFGDASITLYIEAYFLRTDLLPLQFRVLRVFLLDVSPAGVETEIGDTPATPMVFLMNDTIKSKTFNIKNIDHTLSAGHSLGIRVEKTVDPLSFFPFSILSPFFSTDILFDSTVHKSLVKAPFNVTEGGIELECYPQQRSVKPGQEAVYEIDVWNRGSAKETVTLTHNAPSNWNVTIEPATLQVPPLFLNYTDVTVVPPDDAQPGDFMNCTITAQSQTGTASLWLNTTVAALTYGVDVRGGGNQQGKPGDTVTYDFTVTNTGDLEDTYTLSVTATSGWNATLDTGEITLQAGQSQHVTATLTIPSDATNGSTGQLTLTVQSQNSAERDSTSVTTTAVLAAGDDDRESFWEGSRSTILFALFLLGAAALLAVAVLLTYYAKKYVEVRCEERMKEIAPGYHAHYTVTLTNPLERTEGGKNRLNYQLAIGGEIPDTWEVELDKEVVTLDGGESTPVALRVAAPERASLDEWASVDVIVKPVKIRGKTEKINLTTLLREPRIRLQVSQVEHTPQRFKEGDRVTSRITIANVGEATADNATVKLLVNGKERNRIEGLTIPLEGRVEVSMPWVAEPGENRIEIVALQE